MEDNNIIKLKLEVEKLSRECVEKYAEIQALRKINSELTNKATKTTKDDEKGNTMDIIFKQETPTSTRS